MGRKQKAIIELKLKKRHLTLGVAGIVLGIGVLSTIITGQCTFIKDAELKTMTLTGNCTTDESILIPEGYTLYGENYTINAKDGEYDGAVIRNAGKIAHVRYLNVELDESYKSCQQLAGVMFNNASGTILSNNIFNIGELCNKEGVKIIGSADDYVEVKYNKTGGDRGTRIEVLGDVDTVIRSND